MNGHAEDRNTGSLIHRARYAAAALRGGCDAMNERYCAGAGCMPRIARVKTHGVCGVDDEPPCLLPPPCACHQLVADVFAINRTYNSRALTPRLGRRRFDKDRGVG